MKKALFSSYLVLGISTVSLAQDKPNVILILTDDQGSIDMNCYGSTDLMTPNMDRLATEGVRFTHFCVGSAVSSPSRACILTGKTPQGAGLPSMASSSHGDAGMPAEQVTIAEAMKQAGYATGHVGKWHVGYSQETMPNGQGFDYSFGHMGGCIDNYSHFFYWYGPHKHDLWENGNEVYRDGEYFPDLMVQQATSFIEENRDTPFFLYLAFNAPHYPLQPPQKWRDYYKDMTNPRRDYAGFVSSTDEKIGEILDLLDKEKLRENTIIILLSDQGSSFEIRTGGGGGNSGPYRGGKFSLFEGGIRVPAIISWKGQIPEKTLRDELALSMDLFPTILDLCGIKNNVDDIEGKSLKKLIYDDKDVHRNDVIYWQLGKQWAVLKDDWKLIGNTVDPLPNDKFLPLPDDALFLVNLKTDSSEKVNVAKQNPDKLKELTGLYRSWEYFKEENLPADF